MPKSHRSHPVTVDHTDHTAGKRSHQSHRSQLMWAVTTLSGGIVAGSVAHTRLRAIEHLCAPGPHTTRGKWDWTELKSAGYRVVKVRISLEGAP